MDYNGLHLGYKIKCQPTITVKYVLLYSKLVYIICIFVKLLNYIVLLFEK